MKSIREKIIISYFSPHTALDVVDMYNWLDQNITICEADGLPWSGHYQGLQGVGDYMSNVTRSIISEIKIEEVYSCGDKVIAIGRSVGKVVKTGRPFDIRMTQLFTFSDGNKIRKVEFLADIPAFKAALDENHPGP